MTPCKYCGSKEFMVSNVYRGYRQNLLVIECSKCRYELIPVVVYSLDSYEENDKCIEELWKKHNAACIDQP